MTTNPSNKEGEEMALALSHSPAPSISPAGLRSILDEIIKYYQKLLLISQEEKRLIIEGDVEDLVACLANKEEVIGRLKTLEKKRQKEVSLICPRNPTISLSELIEDLPEPLQEAMRFTQIRLEAITASIQDINQMNGILVERVLQQITSLLGLLKQMAFDTVTYQPTGLIYESPSGGKTIAKG